MSALPRGLALLLAAPAAGGRLRLRYIVMCGHATAGGQSIGGIPVPPLNLLLMSPGAVAAQAGVADKCERQLGVPIALPR